jgi:hypothetical protein
MSDLREADVADPRALRFETYARRVYTFRAEPGAPVEALARFLAAHVHRPVVGHYPEGVQFKVAAWHRRGRGGTTGMLAIGESSIQFVSGNPADSRTWLYRDIETIGRPDRFRFRVTTNRETYVLELKDDLPDTAYQMAWNQIYGEDRSTIGVSGDSIDAGLCLQLIRSSGIRAGVREGGMTGGIGGCAERLWVAAADQQGDRERGYRLVRGVGGQNGEGLLLARCL